MNCFCVCVFVHVNSFAHSFANRMGSGHFPLLLQLTLNDLFELFISERNVNQAATPCCQSGGKSVGLQRSVH